LIQTILDGIKDVTENLKVKNLIISRQIEKTDECIEILNIAKERKTKIIVIEKGKRINIDKDIYFNILWADEKELIKENGINNNSIVAKLTYGKFKMLFTGDIEQIAEEKIIEMYGENLKSSILKVAHHGSNTSSIEKFIDATSPEIALIGVRTKQ